MSDLAVKVVEGLIVITDPKTGFYAVYGKPTATPSRTLGVRADTKHQALLAEPGRRLSTRRVN
jgi:hypothetical protein